MGMWEALFELRGKSVALVPLEKKHTGELWQAGKAEEIWTFMATSIRSEAEMEASVTEALKERELGSQYPFTVKAEESGKVIGSTRFLNISENNKSAEIGWTWYHPDAWRTRVNTETKLLLLTHAFEEWKLNRIQFKTDSRNIRSQKAISRLGAIKEGVLRKDRIISGGYCRDTVYYSIIREEWQGVKERLLEKLKH